MPSPFPYPLPLEILEDFASTVTFLVSHSRGPTDERARPRRRAPWMVTAFLDGPRERGAPCLLPGMAGHTTGGAGRLLRHPGAR
jgi:hypothetical protein